MMERQEQKPFPFFGEIPVKEARKNFPQPRVSSFLLPTETELFYHPLDLKFRGRLGRWVKQMEKEGKFSLEEVLPLEGEGFKLISLYLFPQPDGRWLGQKEVMASLGRQPKVGDFKERFWLSMIRIIRRSRHGPRALEVLKLPNFLYKRVMEHGHFSGKDFRMVDDLRDCSMGDLSAICGARNIFEELRMRVESFLHQEWNPPVMLNF